MNPTTCFRKVIHNKFSYVEDKRLKELVSKYGEKDWVLISSMMKGRNSRQCRERWTHHLSPHINQKEFTIEEDQLLLAKYDELGPHWKIISQFFEGRTDQMIKNRFYLLQRQIKREINGFKQYKYVSRKSLQGNETTNDQSHKEDQCKETNEEKIQVDDCQFLEEEIKLFDDIFESIYLERDSIFGDLFF